MNNPNQEKPIWGAPERNKFAILDIIKTHTGICENVIEIGSGTGQHAVYFAQELPHLKWQCTDQKEYINGINAWTDEAALPNLPAPVCLDVNTSITAIKDSLNHQTYDVIYSANTLHIMSWQTVTKFFELIPHLVNKPLVNTSSKNKPMLILYGPFNYGGQYTSESNQLFDAKLKEQNELMGIRNFEDILTLANQAGFQLVEDAEMPANNRCLVFEYHRINE